MPGASRWPEGVGWEDDGQEIPGLSGVPLPVADLPKNEVTVAGPSAPDVRVWTDLIAPREIILIGSPLV